MDDAVEDRNKIWRGIFGEGLYDVTSEETFTKKPRESQEIKTTKPLTGIMAKTVIVTGASRGIGLAIAEYLLKTSNNVVVIARSQDALEKLRQRDPEHVRVLAGDLGDLSLAQKGVDLAAKEFGKLDGLIVNHGIIDPVTKLRDTNAEDWKKTFDVNFISAVAFAKAALPLLSESKGCILFTSSGVSVGAVSTWGAYGATKAAMNHFAGQLACEEPNVTSISVRPGVVDTEMQRELREVHSSIMAKKDNDKFLGLHREGKLLKPSEPGNVMARMVLDPPRELNGRFISWESAELLRYQKS